MLTATQNPEERLRSRWAFRGLRTQTVAQALGLRRKREAPGDVRQVDMSQRGPRVEDITDKTSVRLLQVQRLHAKPAWS